MFLIKPLLEEIVSCQTNKLNKYYEHQIVRFMLAWFAASFKVIQISVLSLICLYINQRTFLAAYTYLSQKCYFHEYGSHLNRHGNKINMLELISVSHMHLLFRTTLVNSFLTSNITLTAINYPYTNIILIIDSYEEQVWF